jgi:hypothetical protein
MLFNLFQKVTTIVYETSLDGSIVKKIHDPKTNQLIPALEVVGFPEGDSFLSKIPIVKLKDTSENLGNFGNASYEQNAASKQNDVSGFGDGSSNDADGTDVRGWWG